MKKVILFGGLAAMIGLSACNGGSRIPATFGDSLSYFMGMTTGDNLAMNIASMPDEMKSEFSTDGFLAGVKTVLDADTSLKGYSDGLQVGMRMLGEIMRYENAGIKVNRDLLYKEFAKAIKADSVDQGRMVMSQDASRQLFEKAQQIVMFKFQEEQARRQEEAEKKYEENKAAGAKFINEAKAADKSIQTTESGLSYKVVKQGSGAVAQEGVSVPVVYAGRMIDGKEFDSSKGDTVRFSVNGVIPGFKEALTKFPAGSKLVLYIPENLAYGKQQAGNIEPGSTLVFDLDICENPEAGK